jgi:hypothetical protein
MSPTCNSEAGSGNRTAPGPVLRLEVNYLPPSQNALRNCHWSMLHREKMRALLALRSALLSMPPDHLIGTTGGLKECKTLLSKLESSPQMQRALSKAALYRVRFTRKRRSARK